METTSKQFVEFKEELNKIIESISKDADKFYNNENKAAGVRLRKGYKEIKQLVQDTANATLPKKASK